jgi:hypothetical protein
MASKRIVPTKQSYHRKAITPIEYSGLQEAYDHFTAELFGGELPDVFITYQRQAHSHGYFSPDRFSGRLDNSGNHELALNPDGFINQTDEQICQTLVHEMVHVWQHAHGAPSKRGYHNKQWAGLMKAIGLQPSSTGMVGGKETGQRMNDYIIPGGPFAKAYAKLAATGWKLNLQSAARPGPEVKPDESKTPFICPDCGEKKKKFWGKPRSTWVCLECGHLAVSKKDPDANTRVRYRLVRMDGAAAQPYETTEPPAPEPIKPAVRALRPSEVADRIVGMADAVRQVESVVPRALKDMPQLGMMAPRKLRCLRSWHGNRRLNSRP